MYYNEKLGEIRYFLAYRFFNCDNYKEFIQNKILVEEIVTFDCSLTEVKEVDINNIDLENLNEKQILAIIIRPFIEIEDSLERYNFEFCGYDLVELQTYISAITNCRAMFESINYENLNNYGLISDYKEAVETQIKLIEECPEESHAYCEIIEI